MKILKWLERFGLPKEDHYDEGKYHVTYHATGRMKERGITKGNLRYNLTKKPIHVGETKYSQKGLPSYERYSRNLINARINPDNNNVTTVSRYPHELRKKFIEENKGERKCKSTVKKPKR
jgi:hypothetical protein